MMSTSKTKVFEQPVRLNSIRIVALGLIALALALGVTGVVLQRRAAALQAPEPTRRVTPRSDPVPAVARATEESPPEPPPPEPPPEPSSSPPTVVASAPPAPPAPPAPAAPSTAEASRGGRERPVQPRHTPPPAKTTQAVPTKPSSVSVDIGY